ncbi:non-ribosomal peptide synthetase [Desulfosediminicola flagellatus]|uniref:non-ribosomal peptide synthetase n=1 Tax=Desulfosediminicola flagellatus TaxID=2569541 RepID=UPI0010ABD4DA|nr:non-ribosomal peptide synthetase [Desulfosediminicola flagellatus]
MSNIQDRLESLSPAQRDLLMKKIRQRGQAGNVEVQAKSYPLISVNRHDRMPLSLAQERMWFIEQLDETLNAYTVASAGYIEGGLSWQHIEQALRMVVDRHEMLRTTFGDFQGKPFQSITTKSVLDYGYSDLRSLDSKRRNIEKDALIEKNTNAPFDLASGPLHRVRLIRLEDERFVLLVVMHHIITDGWSLGVFFGDLTQFYNQLTNTVDQTLAPLAIQYADYAAWQHSLARNGAFEFDIKYWRNSLKGAAPLLALPTDRPRTGSGTACGATGSFFISSQLTAGLKTLATRTQSSLFMITLAGFSALLNRYCRQNDIIVGTPVANRKMLEFEPLIGLFVNTLALRIHFFDDSSVESLIQHVRSVVIDAFSHEDAPFEQVVNACVDDRNLDHSPLFQVMFAFQNSPMPGSAFGDCHFTPIAIERNSTHFDLGFFLGEKNDGLEVSFEYRTELFDEETIQRLGRYYLRVLEGMVCSPGKLLSDIPLLSPQEKTGLTCGRGEVRQGEERDTNVIALFEEQCQKNESRIALSWSGQSISYRQLNGAANQIAKMLRTKGVGPDVVVAVALDRSVDMVAAVVGILKAGGACLPVDLSNPLERSRTIFVDSGARILITSSEIIDKHQQFKTVIDEKISEAFLIDTISYTAPAEDPPPLTQNLDDLDDLAYVLYTSGSTGKPKGVAMPHRSLTNLIRWQLAEEGFGDKAITLQFSPLCFDVSFQEIFCTLCSGGNLVLIDENVRRDSEALLDLLVSSKIERLFMPFVALQQLAITAVKKRQYPSFLRNLITAGEQLRITDPVRTFFNELPECRLHNQYGPTESHVVTSLTLPIDVSTWPILPSIGRPIDNCAIYILENNMEPAPVGVPGELFIGGQVCARGYLNRQELTIERFISDPFSAVPDARMYRSGDLARYLPDGSIECLGRVDHQVKIRGFRVELQEIESVLDCFSAVRECAVIVDDQDDAQPELAAYVVGIAESDMADLRLKLAEKLPSYMVPRYLVPIEKMPLTANGKIDRQKLLAIDRSANTAVLESQASRPTEQILCEIWARVLELPTVHPQDNFFDIGGHSLLATQLISEINALFSLTLPIRDIFDCPTVTELADRIDSNEVQEEEDLGSNFQTDNEQSVLSYAQERLWLIEQSLKGIAVYNMPVALRCEGELDVEILQEAISIIIKRHETLRTTFTKDETGTPQKKVLDEIDFALVRHEQEASSPDAKELSSIERIILREANTPFDLERGPLIRAGIIEVEQNCHVILITFHHIICDGWSIGVFSRELSTLYNSLLSGDIPQSKALEYQYHDFSLWQRRLLAGRGGTVMRNYWMNQLKNTPHQLEFPTDFIPPAVTRNAGNIISFQLDKELCGDLHALSRTQASTFFMTMLSAFSWLIFRYTGQDQFLIGTPIANRNQKRFESIIGFFVNMLPIRVDLSGDPTFTDFLKQVRGTCLEAYTHQDMPFDEMVRVLRPDRLLNRHPLVQVVFVLQNTPEPTLKLGNTKLTPIGREQTVAKYDLLVSLTQSNGELHGALEYSTELFSEMTAQGIVELYKNILNTVLKNPQVRLLEPELSPNDVFDGQPALAADDIQFDF